MFTGFFVYHRWLGISFFAEMLLSELLPIKCSVFAIPNQCRYQWSGKFTQYIITVRDGFQMNEWNSQGLLLSASVYFYDYDHRLS